MDRIEAAVRRAPSRLRLVASTPSQPSARTRGGEPRIGSAIRPAIVLLPGTYDIRWTSARRPGAWRRGQGPGIEEKRRLDVRHQEGIAMHIIERFIHLTGRFAVGLGIGLALVSTVVIVRTDLGSDTAAAKPEVVRLDPVVVTMSTEGFRAARAGDADAASALARLPAKGAGEG